MSYHLRVIKDFPVGFWKLDESTGTTSFDSSGCANNGTYTGGLDSSILPIVPGGASGNLINTSKYITLPTNKDYYASTTSGGLGDSDTSDNDFTLEIWVDPSISTANRTILFADDAAEIGLYYENGNIVFQVQNNEIFYTLENTKKAIHLVGVYSASAISLFVDGNLVGRESLLDFKFSNSSLSLQIGPTNNAADYFIADAPAVYRYSLSINKIYNHYLYGNMTVNPLQTANYDQGIFFSTNEENLNKAFVYEATPDRMKSWVDEDTYFDQSKGFISFYPTTTSVSKQSIFYETIIVPDNLGIISSKIEWLADSGITVQVSKDGITFENCSNGSFLPFYNKSETVTTGPLYIKITMSTSDASKYLPRFSKFKIKFYSSKNIYSDNYGYYITSDQEYDIASFNYPYLIRYNNDGIKTTANNGFKINVSNIRTIEFMFSPSALTATTLINSTGLNLSWNGSGTISMTGISEFYVNGVSKSASTSVSSVFAAGMLYIVTIVTSLPISGDLKFNYQNAGSGGPSNMYNNISIYTTNLSQSKILEHYSSYTSLPGVSSTSGVISVTDSGSEYYDDEYIVIRSV